MTLERNSILNKRYRILEILGEGGMGAVYKAVDENLGMTVAVKENLFTTEEYTLQFQIEATILAALRHPNLPRVTDHFVVEEEGQYLVMDFIEGEDLRDRMDRLGTLPDREVIAVGVAMCEALTYLHTRKPKVLHRDMKPGNVKITPTGQIFLVDFGLAKIVQGAQITLTGARAMTPGYSPPEQYGTARTDARSDVYSLGATLYSAVTGSLPEDGLARAMNQVELTPVRKHNPRVSRRLANTLEKSLAVLPDDRYQTAEEFKKALVRSSGMTMTRSQVQTTLAPPPAFRDDHGDDLEERVSSKPREAGEGRRISGQGKQKEPTPKQPTSDPSAGMIPMDMPMISQTFDDEDQLFSGSGRNGQRGKRRFWLSALLVFLVLGGTIASAAIFFPDQARQAFSMLPFAPMVQTPVRTLSGILPETLTPTADATSTQTEMPPSPTFTLTPEPTASVTFTPTPTFEPSPTPEPTFTSTFAPTPLGGGNSQVAFVSDTSGSPQIYLMNADGTDIQPITTVSGGACQPKWSPDGTRLVFISPCAAKLEEYFGTGLYIINADGTGLMPLPSVQDFDPAWSPDGTQIVFTSFRNGNAQLFIMNLDDYSTQMLANTGLHNIQPAWSPDGSRIAFISTRQGPYQVWLMNADGTEPERFARSGDAKFSYPVWSPDGLFLLFTLREPNAQFSRFVAASLVAGGDSLIRLLDDRLPRRGATYSADGAWILFEAWPDGINHDIYMMRSNGQDVTRLTTSEAYEFDPVWRPAVP